MRGSAAAARVPAHRMNILWWGGPPPPDHRAGVMCAKLLRGVDVTDVVVRLPVCPLGGSQEALHCQGDADGEGTLPPCERRERASVMRVRNDFLLFALMSSNARQL